MSNEEKYINWLPRGLNSFWYKEFDEILDDHSKSKDQQIKDLEYLLSFANEYMERMKPLFETPIDTASLHFKFMLDYKSYQQKYPKP